MVIKKKTKNNTITVAKIQRFTCLNIRCNEYLPYRGYRNFAGPNVHFQIQKEAAISTLLIRKTTNYKQRNLTGHLEILKIKDLKQKTYIPTDYMSIEFNLKQTFKVILTD